MTDDIGWDELLPGDVITHLNGRATAELYEVVARTGDTVTCTVLGGAVDGPFYLDHDETRRVTVQRGGDQ